MTATIEDEGTHSEIRFAAMGSQAHVIATGEPDAVDRALSWAIERVAELERLWSRFLPSSEISRANSSRGMPVSVSDETLDLAERAVEAWQATGGTFDPTVLQLLVDHGYDDGLPDVGVTSIVAATPSASPGCSEIVIDREDGTITLPIDVAFDPGGLGKGLAADIVVEEMMEIGVEGALVNLGGDLRCSGVGPAADRAWHVEVGDEVAGVPTQVVALKSGAIASSTCRRRTWSTSSGTAHHLMNPRTGRPSPKAADLVTVISANCCDAEWLATSIAVQGGLPEDREELGDAVVMLTRRNGEQILHGPVEAFVR